MAPRLGMLCGVRMCERRTGLKMADDKDSRPKLKDLAFLKSQLENLQQRVEDEVQAGVGQLWFFSTWKTGPGDLIVLCVTTTGTMLSMGCSKPSPRSCFLDL
ncbi:uncharacterized protein RBU57_009755 isoform 2-T2 [Macrochelys suwanniensis]